MPANVENLFALPPGFRLGEYRIEQYLGSGGFGITYSAIDEHLDHRVAIKEYLPKHLALRDGNGRVTVAAAEDDAEFRWGLDRFLDEARLLACFDHPNIVRVKRFLEAHGTGYIVMEYVDGESLAEMLRRQTTLTEEEIREHVLPLTSGLGEVHAAGLLHRDIKPRNIMVRANGVPVLIDFGSARQAVSEKSHSLTAVVTRGYAPWEQYFPRGKQVPATDIYSLGAVLYLCVTGTTPQEAPERAQEDPLPSATKAATGTYSYSLLTAIDAALTFRAEERPRDIATFLEMVDHYTPRGPLPDPFQDPWREMAIESQFVPLIPKPRGLEPATLVYLQENMQEVQVTQVDEAINFLVVALSQGKYAKALAAMIWGSETPFSVAKDLTLDDPQELLSAAVGMSSETSAKSVSATSSLRPGDKFRDGPECPELVVVPAGIFSMGSPHRVWVPSGKTGLSEAARHFLLCAGGAQPQTAGRVLANVRERLFGWIMRHEHSFGFPFRDVVENSEWLDLETKTELQDGNLGWIEDCGLNRGLGRLADEALEAGYELNPGFWMSGLDQTLAEFDEDYFYRLETAFADPDNGQFWASPDDCEETVGDDEKELEFPDGFDGLSEEEGRDPCEGPMHRVTIGKPVAVGVYPITRGEFAAFVDATGFQAEGHSWSGDNDPTLFTWRHPGFHQTDSHPVVCVSWNDAQEYIEWLSAMTGATYRLLSEAEWEYIARAGTCTPFSFGRTIATHEANYNGGSCYGSGVTGIYRQRTSPVWTFPANAFGLHDVHGNVWEWTQDCCGSSSYWNVPR